MKEYTVYLNANVREGDSIYKQGFAMAPSEEGYIEGTVSIDFKPCLDYDLAIGGALLPLVTTSRTKDGDHPVMYEEVEGKMFEKGKRHVLTFKPRSGNVDVFVA